MSAHADMEKMYFVLRILKYKSRMTLYDSLNSFNIIRRHLITHTQYIYILTEREPLKEHKSVCPLTLAITEEEPNEAGHQDR
jgi:hypothetical protein